jgi:hypothetical protein
VAFARSCRPEIAPTTANTTADGPPRWWVLTGMGRAATGHRHVHAPYQPILESLSPQYSPLVVLQIQGHLQQHPSNRSGRLIWRSLSRLESTVTSDIASCILEDLSPIMYPLVR